MAFKLIKLHKTCDSCAMPHELAEAGRQKGKVKFANVRWMKMSIRHTKYDKRPVVINAQQELMFIPLLSFCCHLR